MADNFDAFYDLKASGITLRADLEFGIEAGLDVCTTVGTIVNELVANSVEHAFPGRSGKIWIALARSAENDCTVSVSDDGRGLSASTHRDSIGLRTARLMLKSIGGELDIRTGEGEGTAWTLRLGTLGR